MSADPKNEPAAAVSGRPTKEESELESNRVPGAVWGGTALLSIGRLVASGSTAIILFVLAPRLSGVEFGRLTFYLAAILLLEAITDFGTSAVVLRDGADSKTALARGIRAGQRQRALFAILGGASVAILAFVLEEPGWPWIALAMLYPITRAPELASLVYQREIAWNVPVLVRSCSSLLRLILVLVLVVAGVRSAGPFLLAHAAGLAVGNLVLGYLARARLPHPEGTPPAPRELFLATLPIGAAILSQQLYFYLDNLFLRWLRGEEELGHYNAAVRVISFLLTASTFATVAALPWLARRHKRGELARATARLTRPLTLGSGVILGLFWPWTEVVLDLLFDEPFRSAGDAMRLLLIGAFVIHANAALLTAVFASERSRAVLTITGSALLLNAALNALWVVPHGMKGAAFATILTELFVGVASWFVLHRAGEAPRRLPSTFLLGGLAFALAATLSTLSAP